MEGTMLMLPSFLFLFLLLAFKIWSHNTRPRQHRKLPPSPRSLPLIGHLHLLKQPLHRTLQNLSQKYGSIFYLQFGSYPVFVVSSPSAVEECFTNNDIVFANRPFFVMGKYLNYNFTTVVSSPYGDHWRNLRRISALEIFSSNRLNAFLGIRRDEMRIFLKKLHQVSGHSYTQVELRPMISELTFNIMMHMVIGKRYCGEGETTQDDDARKFRALIREIFVLADVSYAGDFLPILRWVDWGGFIKRVKELAKRNDLLLQGLIDGERNEKGSNTMIGHLLSLQESQPEYCTDEMIKGLILDIIFGGTDSSSITIEWAMSSLLNNPQVLEKAKNEIYSKIGRERLMDESDIPQLPYLQNIVSETLRLYPAGPLLLPDLSQDECTIGGYDVPKNTILFVNAWAIQRDPQLWDDAEKFKPERFDSRGDDQDKAYKYRYMPFGHGRRACPGMSLANKVVSFALGCMIQCFEWERVNGEYIDLTEGTGLNMPKAHPLKAMCKASDIMKLSSSL